MVVKENKPKEVDMVFFDAHIQTNANKNTTEESF